MIEIVRGQLHHMEAEYRRNIEDISVDNIYLEPEKSFCPQCFRTMKILKTYHRFLFTIKYGGVDLRVKILGCKFGCTNADGKMVTRYPEALYRIVPKGSNFSYDVEVFVGIERYLRHRQREEIQGKLKDDHDISISTGEISNLAKRFIDHLEALHCKCSEDLKRAIISDGGYPLHVDATGEAGSGTIFVTYTSWRGWVLGSWRLTTECADQIRPCLENVTKRFGIPSAIMRDFGRAMIPAVNSFVEDLGEDVKILGCHSHFLKDIGEDLLDQSYSELRRLFRSYGFKSSIRRLVREWGRQLGPNRKEAQADIKEWIQNEKKHRIPGGVKGLAIVRSLAQWSLDYSADSGDLRFPFERPYLDFYKRCKILRRATDIYLSCPPNDPNVLRALKRLAKVIDPVIADRNFYRVTRILSKRASLFDKLRKTLRLYQKVNTSKHNAKGKSEQQKASELNDIRQSLEKFRESLIKIRTKRGLTEDIQKAIDIILEHVERHGDSLWGHVVNLPAYVGGGIRLVNRTNNELEFKFSGLKCGERRRSGRKVLTQDMENLLPGCMLVSNLEHPDYVEIICGSLDKLPEAFAELDIQKSKGIGEQESNEEKINREQEKFETASLSTTERSFIRKCLIEENILAAASC